VPKSSTTYQPFDVQRGGEARKWLECNNRTPPAEHLFTKLQLPLAQPWAYTFKVLHAFVVMAGTAVLTKAQQVQLAQIGKLLTCLWALYWPVEVFRWAVRHLHTATCLFAIS